MYIPSEPSHRLLVLRASGSEGDSQSAWNYVAYVAFSITMLFGLFSMKRVYHRRAERQRARAERHRNKLTEADLEVLPLYTLTEDSIRDILRPHAHRKELKGAPMLQDPAEVTEPEAAHLPEPKADGIAGASADAELDDGSRYAPTETDASCVICLEEYVPGNSVRVLPCGHVFHNDCISHWLLRPKTKVHECPMCKTPCFPADVIAKAEEEARRQSEESHRRNAPRQLVPVF